MTRPTSTAGAGHRRPPAVVIGLDSITGLQTSRILAGHGVPVIGLTNDRRHYASRTRVCARMVQADLRGEGLITALLTLGRELGERAALIPCTDLSVLLVSTHREELEPWYGIALPDHAVVEQLLDKESFLRYAQTAGLPIPESVFIEVRGVAETAAGALSYPAVLIPSIMSATWQANTDAKAFPVADGEELLAVYDRVSGWCERFIAQEWIAGDVGDQYSSNVYYGADSAPLVTFVSRKVRQWPAVTGISSLGEDCRNDEVVRVTHELFGAVGYRGLGYLEMKRDRRTGRHLIIEPNIGRPTGRSAIAEAGGVALHYTAYCDLAGLPLPEIGVQRYSGVKWIDDRRDFQAALHAVRSGRLTVRGWWRSVRGPKAHAVWSSSDPAPFLHELGYAGGKAVRGLAARLVRRLARRPDRSAASAAPALPG